MSSPFNSSSSVHRLFPPPLGLEPPSLSPRHPSCTVPERFQVPNLPVHLPPSLFSFAAVHTPGGVGRRISSPLLSSEKCLHIVALAVFALTPLGARTCIIVCTGSSCVDRLARICPVPESTEVLADLAARCQKCAWRRSRASAAGGVGFSTKVAYLCVQPSGPLKGSGRENRGMLQKRKRGTQ